MNIAAADPTRSGPAFRISILGPEQVESYMNVHVSLDVDLPVVHVFSADGSTHYLTIPLASALIEWKDPSVLHPQMRLPPFGTESFEQMGEQVRRMMEGMKHGLGQD
jgi:hypothetical protein